MNFEKYHSWQDELEDQINKPEVLAFLARFYQALENIRKGTCGAENTLESLINNPLLDNHPWWKPYLRHWQLQNWICYLGELKKALPRGIETLTQLEDPVFDGFPQRHCILNDLVSIYIGMDPIGYHDEIQQKITDELAVIPRDMHCRNCFLNCRLEMYRYGGDLEETGPIIKELLINYSSSSSVSKEAMSELYRSLSDIFRERGHLEKAESYLEKVSEKDLKRQLVQGKYSLSRGWLKLKRGKRNPPKEVLEQAGDASRIAERIGSRLLKWQAHHLKGDFFRHSGRFREALISYIEALNVMEDLGYYRDEVRIALVAALLALKTASSRIAYCIERAEAANAELVRKRYDKEITSLNCYVGNKKRVVFGKGR